MRLKVRHGGGLAGIVREAEIDTASAVNGAEIERLIADAAHLGLPAPAPGSADLSQWEIVVDDGAHPYRLHLAEDGQPLSAPWQSLLQAIQTALPALF